MSRSARVTRMVSRGTAAIAIAFVLIGASMPAEAATPRAIAIHSAEKSELPGFAIRIVPGSSIHLVSRSSKLPISIRNDYPEAIRVQVHVAPSNLRALFPAAIEVTVPANTTYVAQVPVTAIADGDVPLKAWLTTFSGLSLGPAVGLKLSINAEVEDSLISGFAILVAGLGVAGVLRTRAKRLRIRKAAKNANL
jgi:Family of unknown function (DUF6049)